MRKISAIVICLAALAAAPASTQEASESSGNDAWLPSLMTETPSEGFDLAVSMARKAVTTTQTDIEACTRCVPITHAIRKA